MIRISRLAATSVALFMLAGPAFAVLIDGKGSGPLMIEGTVGRLTRLRPPPPPEDSEDVVVKAAAKRRILLRGERVGLAVARYANGEATLVTGGGFDDFVYTRLAKFSDWVKNTAR